jgi:5-deoxy-D-glucuronate isomerase
MKVGADGAWGWLPLVKNRLKKMEKLFWERNSLLVVESYTDKRQKSSYWSREWRL